MSWKQTLINIAPTIASAFGSPLAGVATKAIISALNITDEADIESALQKATPEQLATIRKIDTDFKIELERLHVEKVKIHQEDRESARDREVKIGGNTITVLASIIIIGFLATAGIVLLTDIKLTGEQGAIIGTVIGYISAKADQVVSYYFGSSLGQDSK